jgi:Polyketide cyclase / dehydrase and lipid transport
VATVRVNQLLDGTVHEAETCWYDTSRWPEWVDELTRVVAVEGDWPWPGATVIWESGPAGRGRVRERVIAYEPLGGQTVEVEDDSITGTQRVAFDPAAEGVELQLALSYSIKRRSPLTPLLDLVFVRRPMTISLTRTVTRFALALAGSREPNVG